MDTPPIPKYVPLPPTYSSVLTELLILGIKINTACCEAVSLWAWNIRNGLYFRESLYCSNMKSRKLFLQLGFNTQLDRWWSSNFLRSSQQLHILINVPYWVKKFIITTKIWMKWQPHHLWYPVDMPCSLALFCAGVLLWCSETQNIVHI